MLTVRLVAVKPFGRAEVDFGTRDNAGHEFERLFVVEGVEIEFVHFGAFERNDTFSCSSAA